MDNIDNKKVEEPKKKKIVRGTRAVSEALTSHIVVLQWKPEDYTDFQA